MHHACFHHAAPNRGSRLRALAVAFAALLPLALAACALPTLRGVVVPTATTSSSLTSMTPTPTVLYHSSLTTVDDTWANEPLHCHFGDDGYHILEGYICYAPAGLLADVDVSVQVKQINGQTTSPYGIVLRRLSKGNYYEFAIDSNSKWTFVQCESDTNDCNKVVDYTANAAIHGGLNVENTLEVQAVGSHFNFFVNGTKVGQADDTTFGSGEVGLAGFQDIEVVFTNITIIQPTEPAGTPVSTAPTTAPTTATPGA